MPLRERNPRDLAAERDWPRYTRRKVRLEAVGGSVSALRERERRFVLRRYFRLTVLNREQVMTSETCACYSCFAVFESSAVTRWTDDKPGMCPQGGMTALCPQCGDDTVVPGLDHRMTHQRILRMLRRRLG